MSEYIRLYTKEQLTQVEQSNWYNIVHDKLPDEHSFNRADTQYSESERDSMKYSYTIWLHDQPEAEVVEEIVSVWNERYELDYEIETSTEVDSSCTDCDDSDVDLPADVFELIRETAARYLHNRWVHESLDNGWRYGLKYNITEQTHPALQDWKNLHPSLKKHPNMSPKQALAFFVKHRELFNG